MYIHGLGHFYPENVLDNAFFEELDIGTTDEWIMERVGIRERRTVLPVDYIRKTKNHDPREALGAALYTNSEAGRRAALAAVENAGLKPSDIGMVFSASCAPEYTTPAEACMIARGLGIEAPCVDINSACSSFGAQVHLLSLMRPEALPDFVLIVQAESNTCSVDYRDRRSAVLWGDGATAAVLSTRVVSRARVTLSNLGSRPSDCGKVTIRRFSHFTQDGPAVQAFAIRRTAESYAELAERAGPGSKRIFFIGHQANLRMLESVCRRCGIQDERHLYNVDLYGNTGAAGAAGVLSRDWRRFAAGDAVVVVTLGAGLTWASFIVTFQGEG